MKYSEQILLRLLDLFEASVDDQEFRFDWRSFSNFLKFMSETHVKKKPSITISHEGFLSCKWQTESKVVVSFFNDQTMHYMYFDETISPRGIERARVESNTENFSKIENLINSL